jgi:hypothetical protein
MLAGLSTMRFIARYAPKECFTFVARSRTLISRPDVLKQAAPSKHPFTTLMDKVFSRSAAPLPKSFGRASSLCEGTPWVISAGAISLQVFNNDPSGLLRDVYRYKSLEMASLHTALFFFRISRGCGASDAAVPLVKEPHAFMDEEARKIIANNPGARIFHGPGVTSFIVAGPFLCGLFWAFARRFVAPGCTTVVSACIYSGAEGLMDLVLMMPICFVIPGAVLAYPKFGIESDRIRNDEAIEWYSKSVRVWSV